MLSVVDTKMRPVALMRSDSTMNLAACVVADLGVRRVELALDGADFVRAGVLGYEVNSGVYLAVAARPIGPAPHFGELLFVDGIGFENAFD